MRPVSRTRLLVLAAALSALLAVGAVGAGAGTFPGTNGVIAYTCGVNVCKVASDGSASGTLLGAASDPSWVRGGAQVFYVKTGLGIYSATVSNGAASNEQPFVASPTAKQPSITSDAFEVAYVDGAPGHVFVRTTSSATPIQLTSGLGESYPSFAPDDLRIAYVETQAGALGTQICVLTLNFQGNGVVGNPACFGNATTGNDTHPNWSPDGTKLVFDSTRSGATPQLYTLTVTSDASASPTLLDSGIQGTQPAYSPDGSKIVYVNVAGNLATTTATGLSPQPILNGPFVGSDPDWQPLPTQTVSTSCFGSSGPPQMLNDTCYPTITLPFGQSAPLVGSTLFASTGSWAGAQPITYTYQWKKCDSTGACYAIPKATSSSFAPGEDLYGWSLRVEVTATNSQGSASQNSRPTPPVTEVPPVLRVTPQITGQNVEDQTLSVGTGTWDGTLVKFSYEWRRCNPQGDPSSCVKVPGATGGTYTQTAADVGFTFRVLITGTNLAGSDSGLTNHTFPTVPRPRFAPTATTAPRVTGSAKVGHTLSAFTGSWSGEPPIATSVAWQRCDATGAGCRTIVGATRLTYTLRGADAGYTIRLLVTATNSIGTTSQASDPTDAVMRLPRSLHGRRIVGSNRSDYLGGSAGNDTILGRGGNDTIVGGAGDDRISGGAGNDVIDAGSGADRVAAGPGSDTVMAADGERDTIDCGAGNDRVVADSFDKVENCESVDTGKSSGADTGEAPGAR